MQCICFHKIKASFSEEGYGRKIIVDISGDIKQIISDITIKILRDQKMRFIFNSGHTAKIVIDVEQLVCLVNSKGMRQWSCIILDLTQKPVLKSVREALKVE